MVADSEKLCYNSAVKPPRGEKRQKIVLRGRYLFTWVVKWDLCGDPGKRFGVKSVCGGSQAPCRAILAQNTGRFKYRYSIVTIARRHPRAPTPAPAPIVHLASVTVLLPNNRLP